MEKNNDSKEAPCSETDFCVNEFFVQILKFLRNGQFFIHSELGTCEKSVRYF